MVHFVKSVDAFININLAAKHMTMNFCIVEYIVLGVDSLANSSNLKLIQ
jgi:hypothetical protein